MSSQHRIEMRKSSSRLFSSLVYFAVMTIIGGAFETAAQENWPLDGAGVNIAPIPDMDGGGPFDSLPEPCNWYEIDGQRQCQGPSSLEKMFPGNKHALSLANIVIELQVGERAFSGSSAYCGDVRTLVSQMQWVSPVTCNEIQSNAAP
jgi:hypothetical protein